MKFWNFLKEKLNFSQKPKDNPDNNKWFIEYKGEVIGQLINPEYDDMFWVFYDLIPKDETALEILSNSELWNQCEFKFRNQITSSYADNAIIAGKHILSEKMTDEKISMRALYRI